MTATGSADKSAEQHTQPQRAQAAGHIVLNVILVVVFGLLYWKSQGLPSSMWEPLGAGSFPRLMLGALICFNVVLVASQVPVFMAGQKLPAGATIDWLWRRRLAFVVMALFFAYVIGIHWLGFAWASFGFLLVTQIVLGARAPRSLLIAVVIAVVFSYGLDALFGRVFNILLPSGLSFG